MIECGLELEESTDTLFFWVREYPIKRHLVERSPSCHDLDQVYEQSKYNQTLQEGDKMNVGKEKEERKVFSPMKAYDFLSNKLSKLQ
jgi:hypothetical protein